MLVELSILSFGVFFGAKYSEREIRKMEGAEGKTKTPFTNIQQFLKRTDNAYQRFFQKRIDPLFGDRSRDRQLELLALDNDGSYQEQSANRYLGIASLNLVPAVLSRLFFPGMILLTLPVILLFAVKAIKDTWRQIVTEHRPGISILDGIFLLWATFSGYWFAASVAIFLFGLSHKLLLKTKDNAEKKLIRIFNRHPRFAWVLLDNQTETEIPFEQLKAGDVVVVNTGEMIPADGAIIKGAALIGEQWLTGESAPKEKEVGEQVFASTVLLSGKVHVLIQKAGRETAAAKLGEILKLTTSHKTSIESKAERITNQSILPTLGLGLAAYPLAGSGGALAVLFSCVGYSMRFIGPLSNLNALRTATHGNILVKDGRALEMLCRTDIMIFDKTGTLTLEQPFVKKIHVFNDFSENKLLTYAAAAEYRQHHPMAKAILAAAEERALNFPKVENGICEIGFGVKASLSGQNIHVGSRRFMEAEQINLPEEALALEKSCGRQGYSLVMIAVDSELVGALELHPSIRPEARQLIAELRKRKIGTYILSGDQKQPTQALASALGVDDYYAEILPGQKADIVAKFQREGKNVCFAGDGINDAVALKQADVSVSLHGASTAAVDAAHIVLMDGNLESFIKMLDLSREFESRQNTNMMISILPSALCMGGVFFFHFGLYMAMVLYYSGLTVGLGSSMRPLLKNAENNPLQPTE